MKNILTILIIIIALHCKAQTRIISISMNEDEYFKLDFKDGDYFKDTENKYAPFIGTWKWVDNNDQLIIVIEKVEKVFDTFDNTYADYLVGKYKYIKDNIEVINTLNLVINRNNILVPGTIVPIMTRGCTQLFFKYVISYNFFS